MVARMRHRRLSKMRKTITRHTTSNTSERGGWASIMLVTQEYGGGRGTFCSLPMMMRLSMRVGFLPMPKFLASIPRWSPLADRLDLYGNLRHLPGWLRFYAIRKHTACSV